VTWTLAGIAVILPLLTAAPGFSAVFAHDDVLTFQGTPIFGSGWNAQMKSFGPGKIGIVFAGGPLTYVEWERGQGVTKKEQIANVYMVFGLGYYNGRPPGPYTTAASRGI